MKVRLGSHSSYVTTVVFMFSCMLPEDQNKRHVWKVFIGTLKKNKDDFFNELRLFYIHIEK